MNLFGSLFRCCSTFSLKPTRSLDALAGNNAQLKKSLELFASNNVTESVAIALKAYQDEFLFTDSETILTSSSNQDRINRPCFWFISELLGSLGPHHPETASTIARMSLISEMSSPIKLRVIQKRHGGYPVRLNNGKWTWQGPHWSRPNNRTWRTGYSSDFTYGSGK